MFALIYAGLGTIALLSINFVGCKISLGLFQLVTLAFAGLCFYLCANYLGLINHKVELSEQQRRVAYCLGFMFAVCFSLVLTILCLSRNDSMLLTPLAAIPTYYFLCNAIDCCVPGEETGLPGKYLLKSMNERSIWRMVGVYAAVASVWAFSNYICIVRFGFKDDASYPWNSIPKMLHWKRD